MADKFDEDFKNWLKDSKGLDDAKIEDLKDTKQKDLLVLYQKEFGAFKVWLKNSEHSPIKDEKNKGYNDLSDKKETCKQFGKDFEYWASKEKNVDLSKGILPQVAANLYDEYKATFNAKFRQNSHSDDNSNQNTDNSWIQEKIKHWDNEWCQQHDPKYTFERVDADISPNTLKFDIYKTEADKTAGKKAVTLEYNNERDVSLSTEDGKAPDFEFFDKMIREAKENDHVPGVTFEGDMSPDFKAKLAIACIKHGLPMTGFEGKIDLNQLSPEELNSLGDEVTKKVDYHNKYTAAKEAAQAHLANAETKDKPFDLSTMADMNDAAIVFAAYKNAGVTVDGVSSVFKNSPEGLIHTTDFKFMPQEAQETIGKHNKEIRNQMLTRTQGKARVPGPVVAEDKDEERKLAQHVINNETPKVLKSAESHATATKNFKNFILGGLEDR